SGGTESEPTTEEEIAERIAPLWRVICHDDPRTTMEFVVEVLRAVFRLSNARASELMYKVHYTGSAVVGHWPRSVAEKKVKRATALARAQGFPLTFTVEQAE
ncbi:MAG: ATP-dependent Clp protease adaptor ClpS, partial [Planctomycetota bacterium]|nr:ATP-dependent Clp protease adaptor ClpS [Planctomycetota bacterium]